MDSKGSISSLALARRISCYFRVVKEKFSKLLLTRWSYLFQAPQILFSTYMYAYLQWVKPLALAHLDTWGPFT